MGLSIWHILIVLLVVLPFVHGHEAGWAALPGARGLLHRIGDEVDVVTYLGEYFRVRLARALSPAAQGRMARLAPGVDVTFFHPGAGGAGVVPVAKARASSVALGIAP